MSDTNNAKAKKSTKSGLLKFFKETKAELKKVTWPTKEQLVHNTGVIIAFIVIMCVILSLLDFGFTELMKLLIP